MTACWRCFGLTLSMALLCAGLIACGDDADDAGQSGGSGSATLESGDFRFELTFGGAEPIDGEVRRSGSVEDAAPGMEWWGFRLTFKNVSAEEMRSANAPDVGVACGDQSDQEAEFIDSPGFVMGEDVFASGMIDNGGSNASLIPLQVPGDQSGCRFLVRMDPLHDPDEPEIASFPFSK